MVHARSRKFVWEEKFRCSSRRRCLDSDGEAGFRFNVAIVTCNLDEAAAVTADQDDHRELAAKNRHLTVFDVATVPGDKLGYLLHQSDLIGPNRGQYQMIFRCHDSPHLTVGAVYDRASFPRCAKTLDLQEKRAVTDRAYS